MSRNYTPSSLEFKLTTKGEEQSTTPKSFAPSASQKTDAARIMEETSASAYLMKGGIGSDSKNISEFNFHHQSVALESLRIEKQPAISFYHPKRM